MTKDRDTFIEFRRLPYGARWIYVGNNTRIEVKGIGTCRLVMRDGRTLLLHDVLYAPNIRRNLVSVLVLMKMGFQLFFSDNFVKLSLGPKIDDVTEVYAITIHFINFTSSTNHLILS